jgi:hypothetical protein
MHGAYQRISVGIEVMTLGQFKTLVAGVAGAYLTLTTASALTINDPNVIGTIIDSIPASIANEVVYVNNLLGLTPNAGPVVIGTETYTRGANADPGSGSVTAVGAVQTDVPPGGVSGSGYEYVLAKYDGPNAGAVLFYFGGAAFTLPSDSATIWMNPQQQGYGISHWTGFNPGPGTGPGPGPGPGVPDAGSTVALLGLAVTALGFLRRKLS